MACVRYPSSQLHVLSEIQPPPVVLALDEAVLHSFDFLLRHKTSPWGDIQGDSLLSPLPV